MSEPFIGEIRPFAFGYAPRYWAPCNGQILPIAQNQALFSILGTTYGGNGVNTFGLPNLQGRVPMHPGGAANIPLGGAGGSESQALQVSEMPAHTHIVNCKASPGTVAAAAGSFIAGSKLVDGKPKDSRFGSMSDGSVMNSGTIVAAGSGAPHSNMQPYCAVNYCIALQGIYPSRN